MQAEEQRILGGNVLETSSGALKDADKHLHVRMGAMLQVEPNSAAE